MNFLHAFDADKSCSNFAEVRATYAQTLLKAIDNYGNQQYGMVCRYFSPWLAALLGSLSAQNFMGNGWVLVRI